MSEPKEYKVGYHRVETFTVVETVPIDHWAQYKDNPDFLDAIRRTASRALAQTIMHKASIYTPPPFITPGKRSPEDLRLVEHRWTVSVIWPEDGKNYFADQLERAKIEGRQEGLHLAAHQLEMAAVNYDAIGRGLIAFNIRAQATEIRKVANAPIPDNDAERPTVSPNGQGSVGSD